MRENDFVDSSSSKQQPGDAPSRLETGTSALGEFDARLDQEVKEIIADVMVDMHGIQPRALEHTRLKVRNRIESLLAAGRAASGVQEKPFCFYNQEEDAIFMDGEKFVRAAPATEQLPCPICGKEVSRGISWCKTCDVPHAVLCVECHPCGYINTGPCELGKKTLVSEEQVREEFRLATGSGLLGFIEPVALAEFVFRLNALLRSQPVSGATKEGQK